MNAFRVFALPVVLVALTPAVASAADKGSCGAQQTSRIDALMNPVTGGDERFFASGGSPTTLMFLISTYNTMQNFVNNLPNNSAGCSGTLKSNFDAFYIKGDATLGGLTPIDDNTETYETSGFSKFFDKDRFYHSKRSSLDSTTLDPNNPDTLTSWSSSSSACSAAFGSGTLSAADQSACQSCLDSVGWYRKDDNRYVLSGGVLNQNPPKFVTTRAVVKSVAESVPNVRMGFSAFNAGSNDLYDPPRIPVFATPSCNALNPIDNGAIVSAIASKINKIAFVGTEQQIGEALTGIGAYFSTKSAWNGWFGTGSNATSLQPSASGGGYIDQNSGDWVNDTGTKDSQGRCNVHLWGDGVANNPDTNNTGSCSTAGGSTSVDSMCSPCQQNMVIIIADGKPQADNSVPVGKMMSLLVADNAKKPDGCPLKWNATSSAGTCSVSAVSGYTGCFDSAIGGINFCDRFLSSGNAGTDKCTCDYSTSPQGLNNTNKNFMDDVAFFLANYDLRPSTTGKQTVHTYSINIGDTSDTTAAAMLKSIAYAGAGLYYSAANASELKNSVVSAIADVQSKSSSFSGASVAGLQTGSSSEAILPRMLPRGDKPWAGSLWRFEIFNEFIEGRQIDGGLGNGAFSGVYMIDDAGSPVTEDLVTGTFYQSGSTVQAAAFWEAGAVLRGADNSPNGHRNRKLYTVRDSNNDGRFSNAAPDGGTDLMIDFSVANRAALTEYLGVIDTDFCPKASGILGLTQPKPGSMADSFGLTIDGLHNAVIAANGSDPVSGYSTSSQAAMRELCVSALILYVRGADLGDEDGDGDRAETRRSVLADIFHSTPVTVQPPVETFLCDLGIVNQCARTLYSQQLNGNIATPFDTANVHGTPKRCDGSSATGRTPYDDYQFYGRMRDKLVLVGSNDGVLHAFHNGTGTETCATQTVTYNQGTGQEVWGFIPPDQLSRLRESIGGHAYGVDGDIMVRDVWADKDSDNKKDWDEYHTVAVVGEGRGGTHYFALELNWAANKSDGTTSGLQGSAAAPRFLWIFPQPGTQTALGFGKTIASIAPKPPPIGPVLLQKSGGITRTVGSFSGATEERWVVALPGGWSPGRERGRGVYVVDAYTGILSERGSVKDNLIARFEFDNNASGDLTTARSMGQSVAAPVALVDYGLNTQSVQDGFFDTAVWGDVNGQVWVARMLTPGALDGTSGLVTNWRAGRAFEMDRYRTGTPGPADVDDAGVSDPDDPDIRDNRNREPFYYLPSAVIDPSTNYLRVFLGSGDRYALLDNPTGVCRFDNPLACSQSQCSTARVDYRADTPNGKIDHMEATFRKQEFAKARINYSGINPGADSCGNVHDRFEKYEVTSCTLLDGGSINPGRVNDSDVTCGLAALLSPGSYTCDYSSSPNINTNDLLPSNGASTGTVGSNHYYGFWAYGGSRVFNEGDGTVTTYDNGRLTDYDGADGGTGLVNVTSTTCSGPGSCTGPVAGTNGWYLDYAGSGFGLGTSTKTATGSTILASCTLWNTVTPTSDAGIPCQAGAGAPEARLVQANYLTGAPDCAAGFQTDGGMVRFLSRNVVAPPPEPATVIQVSKTGQVRTSALLVEPGKSPTSVNVTTGQDVLQLIYQLPISRSMHNCRHVPGGDDGGCLTNP